MKIIITSGGTTIPIDSVRKIKNISTGDFGRKLANEFWKRTSVMCWQFHAEGSYVASKADKHNEELIFYSYDDYVSKLEKLVKKVQPDVVISAAAVSDYGIDKPVQGKISSSGPLQLNLVPLPKVLPLIKQWCPTTKVVGFKLLVGCTRDELREAAWKTMKSADCSFVAGNDLNVRKKGKRQYVLFYPDGREIEVNSFAHRGIAHAVSDLFN